MIPNRKPSYQHSYDLFWSGDDAIVHIPAKAPKAKREEHARKLRVARETGDWSGVLVGGATPTRFTMRAVDGSAFRKLMDRHVAKVVGENEFYALLFRMALADITNLPGPDGEPLAVAHVHSDYGQIAAPAVVDFLDAINSSIVTELGLIVFLRITDLGKS